MNETGMKFDGIYRGRVVYNYDPEVKGRVKIFVPGIYPDDYATDHGKLPWSEPVMPLFGGSGPNSNPGLNPETGVSTIPHVNAELWIFFETGNQNYPRHFAVCQSGPGWLSENNNQHLIKTDNVRIRVDERCELPREKRKDKNYEVVSLAQTGNQNGMGEYFDLKTDALTNLGKIYNLDFTEELLSVSQTKCITKFYADEAGATYFSEKWNTDYITSKVISQKEEDPTPNDISTTKFDSYNDQCTSLSKKLRKYETPTRVDIEIVNVNGGALNLVISGDVNIKILGDVYEHIIGDKHETLSGDLYRQHYGNVHYVHEGETVNELYGKVVTKMVGDETTVRDGSKHEFVGDDYRKFIYGNKKETVGDQSIREVFGSEMKVVAGGCYENVAGNKMEVVAGENVSCAYTMKNFTDFDMEAYALSGSYYAQAGKGEILLFASFGDVKLQACGNHSVIEKAANCRRIGKFTVIDTVDAAQGGIIDHTSVPWVDPVITGDPGIPTAYLTAYVTGEMSGVLTMAEFSGSSWSGNSSGTLVDPWGKTYFSSFSGDA